MKRRLLWSLILMLGLILVYSCDQEITQDFELPGQEDLVSPELEQAKILIAEMGFDVSEICDHGDFYVVEGDIAISKESLRNPIQTRHYHAGSKYLHTIPTNGDKRTLKIYQIGGVDKLLSKRYMNSQGIYTTESTWEDVFKEAIQIWNSIDGWAINLEWTEEVGDIGLWGQTGKAFPFASVYMYPTGKGNNNRIDINVTLFPENRTISHSKQLQAAVHLLGHAIGFSHTDRRTYAQNHNRDLASIDVGADDISGNHNDYRSVMEANSLLREWEKLTTGDIAAAQTLYPLLPKIPSHVQTSISQTDDIIINQGSVHSYSISCNTAGYNLSNISWSVDGSISGQSTPNATITYNKPGKKLVKVSGSITKDGYSPKSFTHQFSAYVLQTSAPTLSGEKNANLNGTYTYVADNFTPTFDNYSYVWSVTNGQVVSQSGNKATFRFSQVGNPTITCHVVQGLSSGSTTYTSQTASYPVNVAILPVPVEITFSQRPVYNSSAWYYEVVNIYIINEQNKTVWYRYVELDSDCTKAYITPDYPKYKQKYGEVSADPPLVKNRYGMPGGSYGIMYYDDYYLPSPELLPGRYRVIFEASSVCTCYYEEIVVAGTKTSVYVEYEQISSDKDCWYDSKGVVHQSISDYNFSDFYF